MTVSLFSLSISSGLALAETTPAPAPKPPAVIASIKPLHSLVAAVMEGLGQPGLLLAGGSSPHAYSLRPSEASALASARVVFWIGPGLETFLEKPLGTLADRAETVAVVSMPGMTLLPIRSGGTWESDDHDHEPGHEPGHGDGDAGGPVDPHVWLDPANARRIVEAVAAVLARVDPANAAAYAANAARTDAGLAALDAELAASLAPVRDRPFIVFHDAYRYLENRYGLRAAGAVALAPDRPPGARRVLELRRRVAELGAVCVFREPQFPPRLVATVIEGTPARTAVLDPLGADLAEGPGLYPALLRANAAALRDCLTGAGSSSH